MSFLPIMICVLAHVVHWFGIHMSGTYGYVWHNLSPLKDVELIKIIIMTVNTSVTQD